MKTDENYSSVPERPRDLRKKNKRLAESRDDLKIKNREKATEIKRLGGKIDDINESREKWRRRFEEETSKARELDARLKDTQARLDAELQTVQRLRVEIEAFKKKATT